MTDTDVSPDWYTPDFTTVYTYAEDEDLLLSAVSDNGTATYYTYDAYGRVGKCQGRSTRRIPAGEDIRIYRRRNAFYHLLFFTVRKTLY